MKRNGLKNVIIAVTMFFIFLSTENVLANALNDSIVDNLVNSNVSMNSFGSLQTYTNRAMGITVTLAQIISVGGVAFCGIYYMFAGASKKAELKKTLISVCIGCVIIYGATLVIRIITYAFTESV